MKKLIFALVLMLALPIGVMADSHFSKGAMIYQSDHFSFSVPIGFVRANNDTYLFHSDSDTSGFIVFFKEMDAGSPFPSEFLNDYYSLLIEQFSSSAYNIEHISISGDPVVTFQYVTDDSSIYTCLLYYKNGQTLCCATTSVSRSPEESAAFFQEICKRINYGSPVFIYDPYNYEYASRYPDKYSGTPVLVKGKVVQAIRTSTQGYDLRVSTSGSYGDIVYALVSSSVAPEYKILEDDIVIIEGIAFGEHIYTTVRGDQMVIPQVSVRSIVVEGQ